MANLSAATRDAEMVVCPTCGAIPGKNCRSSVTGYATMLHPPRVHLGGVAAESARIRRELGEWLDGVAGPIGQDDLRRQIDRIAPEEG